jgi:poly-gamma-glutamate synthesis protein (capsule biosynthesis protein)
LNPEGPQLLGFVGDLFIERDRPDEVFRSITEELHGFGALFGNLEAMYTEHPHIAPSSTFPVWGHPKSIPAFAAAGFDVLSLANNHTLCAGYEAMLETRRALRGLGIATCGAGASFAEAHEPAIISADGRRVAFLVYSSIFPFGYEARGNRPGLAAIRTRTHYEAQHPNVPSRLEASDPGRRNFLKTSRRSAPILSGLA